MKGLDRPVCLCYRMGMNSPKKKDGPRQRIIDTACDLFYRQGYRATGINQVIKESGVAKASFYDHFPSKADLLYEYVCEMSRVDMEELREEVAKLDTPEKRFYAPFKFLVPWFERTNFRGCPFQNAIAEIPPEDGQVQEVVRQHRQLEKQFFSELAQDYLVDECGSATVNCEDLAEIYLVMFEGAVATAGSCRDLWPIDKAIKTMKQFVSQFTAGNRELND